MDAFVHFSIEANGHITASLSRRNPFAGPCVHEPMASGSGATIADALRSLSEDMAKRSVETVTHLSESVIRAKY